VKLTTITLSKGFWTLHRSSTWPSLCWRLSWLCCKLIFSGTGFTQLSLTWCKLVTSLHGITCVAKLSRTEKVLTCVCIWVLVRSMDPTSIKLKAQRYPFPLHDCVKHWLHLKICSQTYSTLVYAASIKREFFIVKWCSWFCHSCHSQRERQAGYICVENIVKNWMKLSHGCYQMDPFSVRQAIHIYCRSMVIRFMIDESCHGKIKNAEIQA